MYAIVLIRINHWVVQGANSSTFAESELRDPKVTLGVLLWCGACGGKVVCSYTGGGGSDC